MILYYNNVKIQLTKQHHNLNISILDSKNGSFNNFNNELINLNENFKIPKIKNYQILKLLSYNINDDRNYNNVDIKLYNIYINIKNIVNNMLIDKEKYKYVINTQHIYNLINELKHNYHNISSDEYLESNDYTTLISKLTNDISVLLDFLTEFNMDTTFKNSYIIDEKLVHYKLLDNIIKNTNKNINIKPVKFNENIFIANDEIKEKLLDFENITFIENSKKLIYRKEENEKHYIYYSSNVNNHDVNFLKIVKSNKYMNLNYLFKENINFNPNNTFFIKIKEVNKYEFILQKYLFTNTLDESDFDNMSHMHESDSYNDEDIHNTDINEYYPDDDDNLEEEKENILKELIEENNEIVDVDSNDLEKEIEDELFF